VEFDDITNNLQHETNVCKPSDVKFERHQILFTVGYTFDTFFDW
jgi:hypothetical protein